MTPTSTSTRTWRYFLRSIVALLCVWAGMLVGTGTYAAEHPTALHKTASLSAPGDESLVAVIKTSLSVATVRTDSDRGSFKSIYLATLPPDQTRLGQLCQVLKRTPSTERYIFHRCCVAQAGGTRAPPINSPFPCLLSLLP